MFLIMLHYQQPLDIVDEYLPRHREFLQLGYDKNYFIVSGPQTPRVGGVVLSQLTDKAQLENILKEDPFYTAGIAEYEIIEFSPVKFHADFASFVL